MIKSLRGFTLIELVIVIAVVSIITVAVTTALNPIKRITDAQDASIRSQAAAVGQSLDICMGYFDLTGGTQNGYNACSSIIKLTATQSNGGAPGGPWLKSTPSGNWGFLSSVSGGGLNGCVYTSTSIGLTLTYYIFQSTNSSVITKLSLPDAGDCP